VEIRSSKALGSNVDGMLKVVDGLVRNTLDDGTTSGIIFDDMRDRDDDNVQESKEEEQQRELTNRITLLEGNIDEAEKEVHKYTNRATLLESMLQTKARRAKTLANRVAVMEDAMMRLKDRSRKEREENEKRMDEEERTFAARVANLTEDAEGIRREKEALEDEYGAEIEALKLQRTEMEVEYNATVADLEARLVSSEEEMQHLRDVERRQQQQQKTLENEEKTNHRLEEEDKLQKKIRVQEEQIQGLQTQLAELLDAHSELEQLQNDAEVTMVEYEKLMKEEQETYESSIEVEREERENYKAKWMDIQQELEEDGEQSRQVLNESISGYEALLEEERSRTEEWMEKWKVLNDVQSSRVDNATSSESNGTSSDVANANAAEEELVNLRKEIEEVMMEKANATDKIQELERQLEQQKQGQDEESITSVQKYEAEKEQQQQLQEYLRAQLSTYYKTIQNQTGHIEELEHQIKDMELTHEESMLIATNSVEASQRREGDLLTNIEELELELVTVTKKKNEREKWLNDLQARLDAMEEAAASTTIPGPGEPSSSASPSARENFEQRNEELTVEVASLRSKIQKMSKEKEHISSEKIRLEEEVGRLYFVPRRVRDMIPPAKKESVVPAKGGEPKRQRRRRGSAG